MLLLDLAASLPCRLALELDCPYFPFFQDVKKKNPNNKTGVHHTFDSVEKGKYIFIHFAISRPGWMVPWAA